MESISYTNRPLRDDQDLQTIIEMISRRPTQRVMFFPSIVDVKEISGTTEGRASFHLWHQAERLAAFAYLSEDFFAYEIDPSDSFESLLQQILTWVISQFTLPSTTYSSVFTSCREDDKQGIALLQENGFSLDPIWTIHFTRPLGAPIPRPVLPEGFTIRPLRGETEVGEWLAVHYAAHEFARMTAEFRLAMMHTDDYCPEIDLVAVAPDGRLAAYAMCHFSKHENLLRKQSIAYTDPVATHPEFQGKGLAQALLLYSFQQLKDLGMDVAEVSTSSDNTGMIKTALSAGFREYSKTIFFGKPLG